MFWIPPRVRRPINRRTIAAQRPALQPQRVICGFPHTRRVAAEFSAAVQAPMFLIQVGPVAAEAMVAEKIELFVEGK